MVFGDGSQTRDFTYVSDTARGIIEIGCAEQSTGKTFNLGSGKEITINDLARNIAKVTGHPDARTEYTDSRPGDVLRLFADSSLAFEQIGFKPRISLYEGLCLLKQWYENQGIAPEKLLEQEQVCNWLTNNNH